MNDDNSDAPQQSTKVFDISSDFDIKPANETDESTSSSSDVGKISIVKKNPTTSVTPTSNTTNPTINNNIPAQTRTPFPSKLNVLSAQANLEGRTPPVATPQPKPIPPITKPLTQTTVVNQPAPTIQTNTPVTPPPTSSPVTQTSPAPTLSTPTKTAQTPSSTTTPANTIYQSPNVRPIRTYEGDMAEILAHKRTSVATIAIAENKKKEGQEVISNKKPEPKENSGSGRKILLFLLSLILIGAGVIGAYYLYTKSPLVTSKPTSVYTPKPVIKSIIPADTHYSINIDNSTRNQLRENLLEELHKQHEPNTVTDIIITRTINGAKTKVPLAEMLSIMDITAPSILVKSFLPDWMLGIYTDEQGNNDFFVTANSDFFQDSFAGMLNWEKVMADDIRSYITTENIKNIVNGPPLPQTTVEVRKPETKTQTKTTTKKVTNTKIATTSIETASTTPVAEEAPVPFPTLRGQFSDRIIKSRDARVFKTSDGKTLFIYSFINGKTLIISGREATLSELITRLEKQAYVR
jgi:hypothetical protein